MAGTGTQHAEYDWVVIGSGPAGQKAAMAAAKLDKTVAIVEQRQVVGGVCVHTGTIPSKTLREAALHFTGHRLHSVYGESYRVKNRITMADLTFRVNHVIQCETDVIANQMNRNGVDMFFGEASFTGPHRIEVHRPEGTLVLKGRKVLVACGTCTHRPDHIPFRSGRVVDSDEILHIEDLPRSLVIVGGGVIGCEYAAIFACLGVEVTLVERNEELLGFADREIVDTLIYHLRDHDVTLRLGEAVKKVGFDKEHVVTGLESGKRILSDMLLFTAGRNGATAALNLPAAGLEADERGRITVNRHFQTSVRHIYAAGDVVGFPSLASTSMEQGRQAACHAFDQTCESFSNLYPYGIYTIPEISMVGETERSLTEKKVPYEIGIARYDELAKGHLIGEEHGMLKLLFHRRTHRLLGVHAIGDRSTELIHIGQAVMAFEGRIDYFINTVFNYPTLAEAYKVAAYDGLNRL